MNLKFFLAMAAALFIASPASAYIGPGAGMGAIGTVVAVLGAFVLLIVGFIWYPVKRMIKGNKKKQEEATAEKE